MTKKTAVEDDEEVYVLTRKGAIMNVLMNCGVNGAEIIAEAVEQRLKRFDADKEKP